MYIQVPLKYFKNVAKLLKKRAVATSSTTYNYNQGCVARANTS
jgi:hypothetical protein